ncbi:EIIBC-MurNAc [Edwardsiella tarda]|nr:EIIBC-MurNAc [Edwardsiella tarda]
MARLFLIAVVFGIHPRLLPAYFALMDAQGFNSLLLILAMTGAGQLGATLALFFSSAKGARLRSQIKGALFPGWLGIGEALIYSVTLPRVKSFVTACLRGAETSSLCSVPVKTYLLSKLEWYLVWLFSQNDYSFL